MLHVLTETTLQVQKNRNHFFGVASPGIKTKLSLEQEASMTSLFPSAGNF